MRRVLALIGFVVVVALALTLLWRVYVHHTRATPGLDDEPALVVLAGRPA